MTDTDLLKEVIAKRGLKLKFVADFLGLSAQGLRLKIENKLEFRTSEVSALCDLLCISSLSEKEKIFFSKKDD